MLGEATRPWLGVTLREPDVETAIDEAIGLIAAGIDLIRVEIPIGRELADRMADAGLTVPQWQPRDARTSARNAELVEPAPTGSQRALARLRGEADRRPRGVAPMSASRPSPRPSGHRKAPSSPPSNGST